MCCVVHRAAVFFAVEQLRGANRGSYSKLDGGGSTYAIAMMTGETRGLNFAALHEYDDKTLGVEVQYLAQVLGRDRFYTHTHSFGGRKGGAVRQQTPCQRRKHPSNKTSYQETIERPPGPLKFQ